MSACPYGECPRGGVDWCDCWDARPASGTLFEPEPEACYGCYVWSGEMKVCDGCCEGHAEKEWIRKVYGPNWQCRQLLHKGRKP